MVLGLVFLAVAKTFSYSPSCLFFPRCSWPRVCPMTVDWALEPQWVGQEQNLALGQAHQQHKNKMIQVY